MKLHTHFIPGLAIATHVVGDDGSGEAAVIDPTRDVAPIIRWADDNHLKITKILETHVHADFVSGSRELKAALPEEASIVSSKLGGDEWTPPYADQLVSDGDSVEVGRLKLSAFHSPGHTPEHVSWTVFDTGRSADVAALAFTGDFVFVGDVGRPDLLGEEAKRELAHQLYNSLFEKLPALPDFTEIYPAHGAGSLCGKSLSSKRSSTLGYERKFNSSLQHEPEADWVASLMDQMPPAPPYFRRMKEINRKEPKIVGRLPVHLPSLAAGAMKDLGDNVLILDVRSKEAFAAAHIEGSWNIPLADTLATWAGWVLPPDRPLLLVADSVADVRKASQQLSLIGFDDQVGMLSGGIGSWETGGRSLQHYPAIDVADLKKAISAGAGQVLDVRTESEYVGGHIAEAKHIHSGMLLDHLDELDREQPIKVICGSGYRGAIATSLLKAHGFPNVSNVLGGMMAWNAAGYATEKGPGVA